MARLIYGFGAIANSVCFIQQAGYGIGIWEDPQLNSAIICAALLIAAIALFDRWIEGDAKHWGTP